MDSMVEILNECLHDSNIETVSKAELRKKYLVKTGLAKLPKEERLLFTSAVNTAYLNYISTKIKTSDTVEKIKTVESPNKEIKENTEVKMLTMDSCSEDDITSANIKEDIIADLCTNDINNMQMEHSSESDEKSLPSYKNDIKKSSNGIKKQRSKRTLSSSSEDESIEIKLIKNSKSVKKVKKSRDPETKFIAESKEKKNVSETKNRFKKDAVDLSDSDEPLTVFQKKSNSFNGSLSSIIKSDESENECTLKYETKQTNNTIVFEDKPIKSSINALNDSKNHSVSEDEPLIKFQKSYDFMHSNRETKEFETKQKLKVYDSDTKLKNNSSDSDDEYLTKYGECNDSIRLDENSNSSTRNKLNSSNKSFKSIECTSGSENEFVLPVTRRKSNLFNKSRAFKNPSNESLAKYSKKKTIYDNSDEELSGNGYLKPMETLSDSEDEFSISSNKKTDNSINSETKPIISGIKSKEKTLKKKVFVESDDDVDILNQMQEKSFEIKNSISSSSEDEPLSTMKNKKSKSNLLNESCISRNSSGSEDESPSKYSKKKIMNSIHSDEEPVSIVFEKSNFVTGCLKSVKNLSDSEYEPVSNLNNKVTNNSSDSEIEPDKKIIKGKAKHLKKPVIKSNKSKEQFLKNKKLIDSNEDSKVSNGKEEKSFVKQKNFLSDSSEDEPLNTLSTKKVNKQKSSESGSGSFVDENEKLSSKKNKPSEKKKANVSGKQSRKHPSASENKIEHLKKYLRVAGIRISNYNKLFENCKTMKAKCEKLMSLLEKEGLKGRPTLEKCKKLRKKIETKREIAELDMSNILKIEGGRPKRSVCSDTTNCKPEENSTPVKKFSRLQDIVDSEDSD